MAELEFNFEIAAPMAEIFEGEAMFRGANGGRGSTKSWGFARRALQRMVEAMLTGKKLRVLCGRELQNSLKDSVLQLLIDQIEMLGVQQFFDYGESYVRGADGVCDFLFKGLRHNYKEIKSTEGIDICWLEEAETISEESFRTVFPTVFRNKGSEVWLSWNSESSDSPIHKRFILDPPPEAKIIKINYMDNPWFSEEMELLRQADQKRDPDVYAHVWEGECLTRTEAQVLGGKWRVDSFKMPLPEEIDGGPYYGCDWGFSSDPLALSRCWIRGNRLYIDQEAGGRGIEIKDTPAEFDKIPGIKNHMVRADNARPELISHMQGEGYRVVGAEKWPGSVEDGITHLRSYDEIIIHERCIQTAKEARLWSYKINKQSGDVLPVLIDANNHWFDGIRYALSPLIKKKSFTGRPVYAGQFNETLHISLEELWPVKNSPIYIGIAIEQTTHCAIFAQINRNGQLRVIEEVIERNMGVSQFAKSTLLPLLRSKYKSCPHTLVSFKERSSTGRTIDSDSRLLLDEMEEAGLNIESVSSDLLSRRVEAVRWYLGQLMGGRPAISISPACRVLHDGLGAGYQFKQMEIQGGDDIRFSTDPEKNQYVLPNLALQYICLWLREEFDDNKNKPVVSGLRTY